MVNKKKKVTGWKCRRDGKEVFCKKGKKEIHLGSDFVAGYGFKKAYNRSAKDDTTGKVTKFVRID